MNQTSSKVLDSKCTLTLGDETRSRFGPGMQRVESDTLTYDSDDFTPPVTPGASDEDPLDQPLRNKSVESTSGDAQLVGRYRLFYESVLAFQRRPFGN